LQFAEALLCLFSVIFEIIKGEIQYVADLESLETVRPLLLLVNLLTSSAGF